MQLRGSANGCQVTHGRLLCLGLNEELLDFAIVT
jgi:hypothetical protein